MPLALGKHWIVELYDCNPKMLEHAKTVEEVMVSAARVCNATIVETVFHEFNPFGVSGMVIIAESHLAIHTWPEYRYAAIDIFTCGETLIPDQAAAYVGKKFEATKNHIYKVTRGRFDDEKRPIPARRILLEGINKRRVFPRLFKAAGLLMSLIFNYCISTADFDEIKIRNSIPDKDVSGTIEDKKDADLSTPLRRYQ